MAIALVGSAGAISTVTTTTVTPVFAQATTAGNLLVCIAGYVTSTSGVLSTSSSGWQTAITNSSGTSGTGIFYKPNCGASETAPTISSPGGTVTALYAELSEWSGVALSSPVEQTSVDSGGFSQVSFGSNDSTPGMLVIGDELGINSKSATDTVVVTWTPSGGTTNSLNNTGGTKTTQCFSGSSYITSVNNAHDVGSWSFTPSTGLISSTFGTIASFKPPAAAGATIPDVNIAPYAPF